MRASRRRLLVLAAVGATLVVGLLLDPLGLVDAVRDWFAVARPADGPVSAMLETAIRRRDRVERLLHLRSLGPAPSAAALATGLGAGLVVGGVGTYLYQRRLIRRGEWDD